MTRNPSDTVTRAWIRLMRAREAVLGAIEADLKAAGVVPLAWYDVLLELTREKGGRLRPADIEKKILLPQYSLSRLIDRLEREGLVARAPHEDDARGQWVAITEKGRAAQARAWKVYARSILKHVGEKLDDKSAAQLAGLLERLMAAS
jgi:DNA-binding MarR family transcriptional regulator